VNNTPPGQRATPHPITLAVDPGKRAGYAAFADKRMEQSSVIDGDSVKEIGFILGLFEPDILIVEDQYIPVGHDRRGKARVMNQKGLKTLMRRRYIWEVLAEERGIRVESVNPQTWQAYFKLKAGDKAGMVKLASVLIEKDVVVDEADAVLIGWWFVHTQGATSIGGRY
jgi:hypothetical protein